MLVSFLVYLRPQQRAPLGSHGGRSLHGLFFHLVEAADPALAEALHAPHRVKPFTVSPLLGRFEYAGQKPVALPEETYRVRYTVLLDRVLDALGDELLERHLAGQPVTIDGLPFEVTRIAIAPRERGKWVATNQYESLLRRQRAEREITLHFASATAFKMGKLSLLLPLPRNVFGSYLFTWSAFAPLPMPADLLEWVEEHVAVSRYELQTSVIQAGRYKLLGFTGRCTFRVMSDDTLRVAALNALADFALFCGTGMKTTQGMGQTRREGW